MNVDDHLRHLEARIDDLVQRLGNAQHELTIRIDDVRNDGERATDSLRSDLSSLEHKVDYQ